MLLMIDHEVPPAGPPDADGPLRRWQRRVVRLQDRLWRPDEKWAADSGYDSRRSASGWRISVRDKRFDLRHQCAVCDGEGRHRVTGAECEDCDGSGVVTLEPPDETDLR